MLVNLAGFDRISDGTRQLADVVKQRGPAQSRAVARCELHLFSDEVREDANTLGVTAGLAVVDAERGHQLEHRLHVRDLATGDPFVVSLLKLTLKVFGLADATGDSETLGRLVGKQE